MASSKTRSVKPLDKLVRVRDLLAVNRALLTRIEAAEREILKLKEHAPTG